MATKNLLQILAVFVVGMAGGIFASHFWPYQKEPGPTYVTEKKETTLYVQENTAMRESVQDVLPAVVGVRTKTVSGETLEGSGLVLTSDGLLITLASLVPRGSEFAFFIDGQWPAFQILKRDLENDLALVKVEKGGLKTRGFADTDKIKLAEPVFLVGMDFATTTPQATVNAGIITRLDGKTIQTNIVDTPEMAGSPLFDIEGRVVGLNIIGEDGKVSAVPVSKIRVLAGF